MVRIVLEKKILGWIIAANPAERELNRLKGRENAESSGKGREFRALSARTSRWNYAGFFWACNQEAYQEIIETLRVGKISSMEPCFLIFPFTNEKIENKISNRFS